jgi:Sulfotransferase family
VNHDQSPEYLQQRFLQIKEQYKPARLKRLFKQPVIIVSTPRSGSTLLFETLSRCPDLWTIGGESHMVYRAFPELRAENPQLDSGRLTEQHAQKETGNLLRAGFLFFLRNRQGRSFLDLPKQPESIRFLEKTPRNALNIPFLNKIFPDARYIYLHRDASQNISSIIDAWEHPNFITFPNLPGWARQHWCLLLPPGWRVLNGKPVADIAAFQWRASNLIMLNDLKNIPSNRWISVSYENLIRNPAEELQKICKFSGIRYDEQLSKLASTSLPLSSTTVTPPNPEKWRKHEQEIIRVLPDVADVARLIEELA